eukprot:TRINITY_DN849_c0_g1_i2.p1 TRINITY_DN849_c0_g1~~TRINITY_DN849_c0_g1_i2.p1  ORF type:complete len:533 (-),score=46.70 TRINITY_DN849_c0_g1_i2:688-2286(-)
MAGRRPAPSGLGLSIHRNEFHSPGILEGNWVENRAAYNDPPSRKFNGTSTTADTYQAVHVSRQAAEAPVTDLPHALLLADSSAPEQRQFASVNHLTFRHPHVPHHRTTDVADCRRLLSEPDVVAGRQGLVARKRAAWARERGVVVSADPSVTASIAAPGTNIPSAPGVSGSFSVPDFGTSSTAGRTTSAVDAGDVPSYLPLPPSEASHHFHPRSNRFVSASFPLDTASSHAAPSIDSAVVAVLGDVRARALARGGCDGLRAIARSLQCVRAPRDLVVMPVRDVALAFRRLGVALTPHQLRVLVAAYRAPSETAATMNATSSGVGESSIPCEGGASSESLGWDDGVDVWALMKGLRGVLAPRREEVVRLAYRIVAAVCGSAEDVSITRLVSLFDASALPDVTCGRTTTAEAVRRLATAWAEWGQRAVDPEAGDEEGLQVSEEDFLSYYADISPAIEDDVLFELTVRNAWHVAGGEGAARGTTCRRVLVTHEDGSKTVEEVKYDLGIGPGDLDAMRANLEAQVRGQGARVRHVE